ncbi:MAG: FKBP-type peptidyl-prolyl cis-trans isomerase, partial [Acidimicrobiales bacterium]
MTLHRPSLAIAVLMCLVFVSCGDDSSDGDVSAESGETSEATVDAAPPDKPTVSVPETAPETLEIVDITEGTGDQVAAHDWVQVHYVGVSQSTGEEFDSSYDRGPVEFPLDQVIPGWSEGLLGMREGGRRQLVIPADMAYADSPPDGSGIAPDDALVFVVDLLDVTVSYADKPEVELPDEAPDELVIEDIERSAALGADPVKLEFVRALVDLGRRENYSAIERLEDVLRQDPGH